MTGSELVIKQDMALSEIGALYAQSGFFKDSKQAAQAIVKIMSGQEIGVGPTAAMTGLHIIEGKVEIGAGLLARLVRQHPDYDYKILELNQERCRLSFSHKGEELGVEEFSIEDAERASLVKPGSPWEKYPKNMVFARAMSNGVNFYCPDVTGPRVYVEGEISQEAQQEPQEIPGKVEEDDRPSPVVDQERMDLEDAITNMEQETGWAQPHILNARRKYLEHVELRPVAQDTLVDYKQYLESKLVEETMEAAEEIDKLTVTIQELLQSELVTDNERATGMESLEGSTDQAQLICWRDNLRQTIQRRREEAEAQAKKDEA